MPVAKPELHEAAESVPDVPEDRTLTLAEAAEMLGISEQLLAHVLNQDIVPHHMVGGQPRILLRDVMAYKKVKERRRKAMDRMIARDQEMGLYPTKP